MPLVDQHFRVLPGPANAALWGASYGGVAALYTAIRRPLLFDSFIIESPSVQIGNGQMLRDTVSLIVVPKRIALGIGTAEFLPDEPDAAAINANWVREVKLLADHLRAADLPPSVQLTVAEGAHHGMVDFGRRLAAALLFLYSTSTAN